MDIFSQTYLEGEWFFERKITTNNTLQAVAKGTATFTSEGNNTLVYKEKGELYMQDNGSQFSFFRSFIYQFEVDKLTLIFNDGATIGEVYQTYHLEGERLVSLAPHLCGVDIYDGFFEQLNKNSYKQYVKVMGAKKDYEAETVYGRD